MADLLKPRLLVLTPRFPYPVVGGDRLRIYQICLFLSRSFSLTLLSFCENSTELNLVPPDDGVFDRIERFYLPKWRSFVNCLLAIPGRLPLQVAYYQHSRYSRRARELANDHDAVLVHLVRVSGAVNDLPIVKFLEMTDAISLNYNRIRDSAHMKRDLRARIFSMEAKRLRDYEESIVDSFDHNFLVSDIDRQYLFANKFEKLNRVSVFSNGVSFDSLPYKFTQNGSDIIFIGNMFSLQNLDAATFMSTEIFPLIRKEIPWARLRLIGRIRPADAERLAGMEGIEVTGEVSKISEAATGGAVGVCPLRLGAGVQNKVLEYMALGLPVVSTSIGLEGFNARNGYELLIADEPSSFSKHVIRILKDREMASTIALAARAYVQDNHSWDAMLSPMLKVIQSKLTQSK